MDFDYLDSIETYYYFGISSFLINAAAYNRQLSATFLTSLIPADVIVWFNFHIQLIIEFWILVFFCPQVHQEHIEASSHPASEKKVYMYVDTILF